MMIISIVNTYCCCSLLFFFLFLGVPLPRVTWWKEHALIDDSYQDQTDGTVKNVLHLNKITRQDLETVSNKRTSIL